MAGKCPVIFLYCTVYPLSNVEAGFDTVLAFLVGPYGIISLCGGGGTAPREMAIVFPAWLCWCGGGRSLLCGTVVFTSF